MTPYSGDTWVQEWTIFYWAWTIAWSPFVGAFLLVYRVGVQFVNMLLV